MVVVCYRVPADHALRPSLSLSLDHSFSLSLSPSSLSLTSARAYRHRSPSPSYAPFPFQFDKSAFITVEEATKRQIEYVQPSDRDELIAGLQKNGVQNAPTNHAELAVYLTAAATRLPGA